MNITLVIETNGIAQISQLPFSQAQTIVRKSGAFNAKVVNNLFDGLRHPMFNQTAVVISTRGTQVQLYGFSCDKAEFKARLEQTLQVAWEQGGKITQTTAYYLA